MKTLIIPFLICLLTGTAYAVYSQAEFDLLNTAYSGARDYEKSYFEELKAARFDSETTAKLALIQAYSSTERPELVLEAIRLAREVIAVEPDGCRRDWATLVLVPLLSLSGDRRAGAEAAENALATMDFARFDASQDPFVTFLAKKLHIKQIGWEQFIRNNLMQELGSYYLNRTKSEGGSDLKRAFDYYSRITAVENKELLLADPRFKQIREMSEPPRDMNPDTQGPEQAPGYGVQRNQLPPVPRIREGERKTNSSNANGGSGGNGCSDWPVLTSAFAAGCLLTVATSWLARRLLGNGAANRKGRANRD